MERTSTAADANLALEYVHIVGELVAVVPGSKKAAAGSAAAGSMKWSKADSPKIPILTNPKKLPIHTKLIAIEDPVLATAKNEETLKRKGSGEGGAAAAADGPADGDQAAVATATEKRKRPRN